MTKHALKSRVSSLPRDRYRSKNDKNSSKEGPHCSPRRLISWALPGNCSANAGALYEVDSEGPRVETWNLVLGFVKFASLVNLVESAISSEFEAALLDIQSLDSGFQGRGGDLELGGCSSGSRDAASAFSQSCFNYAPLIKRLLLSESFE
jgi:hypothetical protein